MFGAVGAVQVSGLRSLRAKGATFWVQFLASAETLASTLTHELGHNLGMNHDDGRK